MVPFLYAIFILSGAAGLIYESIWTRYLGLFVGHSAYAQVIVLVIFLGGMSIGALLVGRRTERLRRPLYWYAGVELATGLIGLVFHDVFVATTHFAYSSVFPAAGVGVIQTVAKWGIAGLLILPQSILLGMTFPLMSAGVVRRIPQHAGRALSMLYFANSLGAAGGVLAAGFWLVALAGLPGTLLVAAMINIVVALAVVIALRTRTVAEPEVPTVVAEQPDVSGVPRARLRHLMLAVSFGTALASFMYEIGWIRMLALVLGSATHSFELMLSAFILGLSLGAFWVRRRADAGAVSLRLLGLVQIAMGSLAIATLPVYLASFNWMVSLMAAFARTPEGYTMFSISRYALCLAVMLPATFCAGMTLPLITRVLVGAGLGERSIGQVYGVNTIGSIVGAGIAGLVLMPVLGLKWLLVAGAMVDLALGVVLLVSERERIFAVERKRRTFELVLAAAAAIVVVSIAVRANFDHTTLTSGVFRYGTVQAPGTRDVIFYKDGRTATVSVRRLGDSGGLTLGTNGKPDASLGREWLRPKWDGSVGPFTLDASTQLFVPLVALAHVPMAREAAVIGFGSGMTTHALLGSSALRHVATIEIEPEMIKASRNFYPANRRAYDDPRSRFVIDDARAYFAASGQTFDLIVSEPSNPWVSGVSGLFTAEFYARVKQYLTPNGVFAQWLHLYEIDDGLVLGVIAALAQHFPTYSIFQLSSRDILIVASAGTTLAEPDWSIFQSPGIVQDIRRIWPITPRTMDALRLADNRVLEPLLRSNALPNSDFYPTLDLNAERTRYMKSQATGLAGLSTERINLAAIVEGRRSGLGDSYAVIPDIPRLQAMAVAASMRNGDSRGGQPGIVAAARKQLLYDQLASTRAPFNWHVWLESVANVEETLHGGMAGVVDTAFYATVRAYLSRVSAPPLARASIDFMYGMAAWDFAEASAASNPLIAAALAGDQWIEPAKLRDGAVMAKLETEGQPAARAAFRALARQAGIGPSDLRTQLLIAYMADQGRVRVASGPP
jgi:spermidine synthase